MPAYRLGHFVAVGFAIATWLVAATLQAALPVSLLWAVVDEVAHAAVAISCAVWLVPCWGWTPALIAAAAGITIDLDHAVAAGCLAPECLMGLAARPALHSLAGALAMSLIVGWMTNPRIGYATAIGTVLHVWRDALAPPGVPLWLPFDSSDHVILPSWSLAVGMCLLATINVVIARRT